MSTRNKLLIVFGLLIIMFICSGVFAETNEKWGDLTWPLEDSVLTISGNGSMKEGYKEGAWDERTYPWTENIKKEKIKKVIIEEGVTEIAYAAFKGIPNAIESVELPNSLTTINDFAFGGCVKLNEIKLPESLRYIRSWAFNDCGEFSVFYIPASVKEINVSAFYDTKISAFKVSEDNPNYKTVNGALLTKNGKELIRAGTATEEFDIPESVKIICCMCFQFSPIKHITIPASVKEIVNLAFELSDLESVDLYCDKAKLGESIFDRCYKLQNVKFIGSFKSISRMMFSDCTALSEIHLPASVITIGDAAFQNCKSLKSIVLHSKVKKIADNAFSHETLIYCIPKSKAQQWAKRNDYQYDKYVPVKKVQCKDKKVNITVGDTYQPEIDYSLSNATFQEMDWSISNQDICTVDKEGCITAIAAGTCKIIGVTIDGSGKKIEYTVSVSSVK